MQTGAVCLTGAEVAAQQPAKTGATRDDGFVGDSRGLKAYTAAGVGEAIQEIGVLASASPQLDSKSQILPFDQRATKEKVSRVSGLDSSADIHGSLRMKVSCPKPDWRRRRIQRLYRTEDGI